MKKNFLKQLLLLCSVTVLLYACVKDKYTGNQSAGLGKSYVRITEAKVYNQFFAPFLDIRPITVFSVRRDAASAADQQTTKVVELTAIPAYITTYNTKNGTSYTAMPSTLYTLGTSAGVAASAAGLTLTFGPGDFAKKIIFNIDGSKVDLSKQYAVAYTISNTGGLTQKAGLDTVLATVAIKNKYDGVYTVTGTMVDITATTLGDFALFLAGPNAAQYGVGPPQEIELRTTSATTCDIYDNFFYGGYYYPISSAATYSQYGSFVPQVAFDLATDKLTAVTNRYGQPVASNLRSGRLDPTGSVNAYVGGKITIKFNMTQPQQASCLACSATAPYVRSTWDEVWTFKGSR